MNTVHHLQQGVLRSILEIAREEQGCSLADMTVLSTQIDPYRLDTASGHRDGAWLAEQLERAIGSERRIHWRGLHYAIVAAGNVRKPNGEIYKNTDADWLWLANTAGKAARWLGYVSFERIVDNRNSEPIVHRKPRVTPQSWVSVGLDIDVPDVADLEPYAGATGFEGRQPYAITIFGEKASLEDVLLPFSERYEADLYLPTGEISDTLLYRMAHDGTVDGRPMVVMVLADCDPAGHQMAVSIGRKLQALKDLFFYELEFEVIPAALTVDHVRDFGLPHAPLKEKEKRADKWYEAFGVGQTEIDALATLQPQLLEEIIDEAISPYFDATLADRVRSASGQWYDEAQAMLATQVDQGLLEQVKEHAEERLAELEAEIADINRQLRMTDGDFYLPQIKVPEPVIDEDSTRLASLISSEWSWAEGTQALKERKSYGGQP